MTNPSIQQQRIALTVVGLLSFLAYGGLVRVHWRYGTLTFAQVPQSIGWLLLAFALYVALIGWMAFVDRRQSSSDRLLVYIFVGALLFRLLLLITEPTLSDDVYRYLWDGYVANQGVSPYAYPINSPELDYLDAPIRAQANHAWMASPYLPAAQLLFGTVTRIAPLTPQSMQVAMVLIDLLNGLLLVALLARVGLPRKWAVVYLWNPLVILETAHGAHVDVWMIFLTLSALWLAFGAKETGSGDKGGGIDPKRSVLKNLMAATLLALATLTKIIPILLLPILFWRWRWSRLFLFGAVTAGFLAAAGFRAGWGLFGPLDGHGLFGALRIYGDQWNFNSGLFHWIEVTLRDNARLGLTAEDALAWSKRTVGLIMLGTLAVVWLQARKVQNPRMLIRLIFVPLAAYVLLSPTFHPWYLLFLLSFLPFWIPAKDEPWQQWMVVAPWLYLSGSLFLSYLTYLDPQNLREYEWVRRTEWLPTLAFILIGLIAWVSSHRRNRNPL